DVSGGRDPGGNRGTRRFVSALAKLAIARIGAGFPLKIHLVGAGHLAAHAKIVYFFQLLLGDGRCQKGQQGGKRARNACDALLLRIVAGAVPSKARLLSFWPRPYLSRLRALR